MIDPEKIKASSIATLRSWGIPVIDHLPQLEAETDLAPQPAIAVARRCMIMSHVIGIGFGGDADELHEAAESWGLMDFASPHERDMLSRTTHTEQERINATWQVECLQSFAWCLGLSGLEPLRHCDDDLASKFPAPYTDPSAFIASATLRSFSEIYSQADLHYRLHWASRNARLTGAEFPVNEGLLRERRKAMDWVIGVEADWDEVPSHT
jgi:Domain of unknown function (DUF4272)